MMIQEIYLIRHTTPKIEKGICYGQSNLELQNTFEEEAKEIQKLLPNNIENIPFFTSPLKRCKRLTDFLQNNPSKIIEDDRLKEMNFGEWEMKKWAEIPEKELNHWMENFITEKTPKGENYEIVKNRANDFLQEIFENKQEKTVIVTHFGIIQSILGIIFECPPAKAFRFELDYGAVIKIKKTEKEHFKVKFLR